LTPVATESPFSRSKDRVVVASVLLLLVYSAVRNVVAAAIRPFWYDELLTWIVAGQPTVSSVFHALAQAADGQPPTYHLLERLAAKLVSSDQIALRLPSILGFCLFEWCIFEWLRKRHDDWIAFVALLIPVISLFYGTFAIEARPYAPVTACLALAAVAYQRVPARLWLIVLAGSLLAAASLHYYSVIFATPFFAAELLFSVKTKSIRWSVWFSFVPVVLPVFFFWPFLSHFKSYYSGHYWSHASFLVAIRSYGWLFNISQGPLNTFSWAMVAGLVLTALALSVAALFIVRAMTADPAANPNFHEFCLIAGFLLLPLILYAVTKVTKAGFSPRYLLPVVLGSALAVACGLSMLSKQSLALVAAALVLTIAIQEAGFWFSFSSARQLGFGKSRPVEQLVGPVGHGELPVFVANGHDYLEADHYASAAWKQRMLFFADPAAAVAYGQPDTLEKELLALRNVTPLRVFEFEKSRPKFPEFLVYSDPSPENNPDWWTLRLLADGYSLQKLATDGHSSVYLAELRHAH